MVVVDSYAQYCSARPLEITADREFYIQNQKVPLVVLST